MESIREIVYINGEPFIPISPEELAIMQSEIYSLNARVNSEIPELKDSLRMARNEIVELRASYDRLIADYKRIGEHE